MKAIYTLTTLGRLFRISSRLNYSALFSSTKFTPEAMFPSTSMPDRDWWSALWPNPEKICSLSGAREGSVAVDLCCGDAYFTIPLANIVDKTYGIELDPSLLEQARAASAAAGVADSKLIFTQGDAMELQSLVPEPVDFVLIANTFHGIPDKSRLTASVARILRHGGTFTIVNWHKLPREETTVLDQPRGPKTEMRMTPAEVEDVVKPIGFTLVEMVELPPYHYGAIFTKNA
jgi:SAM-dependent methyltransferase